MSTSRVITSPIGPAGPVNLYQGTAAGTNTYTTTAAPVPSAYTANDLYVVTFTNGNTGASTLNANGLGAKAIQFNGAALVGGEIIAGETWVLKYDGTQFQMTAESFGQRRYYAASTSGTTAYTATLTPVPSAYQTGCQYVFTVTSTNTGAVTMNFNSLGAKNVLLNGVPMAPGQLLAGFVYQAIYDGTSLQITSSGGIPALSLVPSSYQFDADDFTIGTGVMSVSSNGTSVGTFSTVRASGSASGASRVGSTADGMVGVVILSHGTDVGGFALLQGGGDLAHSYDVAPWAVGGGQIELTFWFKTDSTLSNGTNGYGISFGMVDGTNTTPGVTSTISAICDSNAANPNIGIKVWVGGVAQTVAYSSTPLVASTKYAVLLIINAARTRADLYIRQYGGTFPSSPDASYTGSFPASSVSLTPQAWIFKESGVTSRNLYVDRWQVVTWLAR